VSVHEQGPSLVPETHYIAASGKVHFKVIKQYVKIFLKTCAVLSISGVSADYRELCCLGIVFVLLHANTGRETSNLIWFDG
jgi:hypothetical protein